MKWFQVIEKKLTAAAVLLIVFVILVYTNYSENRNAISMNEAASSIYKDRLVVESYILDYYKIFDGMREELSLPQHTGREQLLTHELDQLEQKYHLYRSTVLTPSEQLYFDQLVSKTRKIRSLLASDQFSQMEAEIQNCFPILTTLSEIQLSEAKLQMDKLAKLSSNSGLYSQLEMAILIIIALIIQALVFTSKKLEPLRKAVGFSMN